MLRRLCVGLVFAMLAAACTGGDSGDGADPTDIDLGDIDIQLISVLRTFNECDALLDHLRTEAAARVGPFGFNSDGWYGPFGDVAIDDAAGDQLGAPATTAAAAVSSPAAGEDAGAVEGVDFSGTNVHELGVDEPDLIKTDGERIFVVGGGELVVIDVASATELGRVTVATGWSSELFLDGDAVLLITRGSFRSDGGVIVGDEDDGEFEQFGISGSAVQRIDVSGDVPTVLETLWIEGEFLSARAVGGVARIVTVSNPQWQLPFVYPQSSAGEDIAAEANRAAVAASELTDWLPEFKLERDGVVVDEGLLTECSDVHAPTEFSGFGVVSVLSVSVDGAVDSGSTTSVLAPGGTVYASTDSLYVGTTTWLDTDLLDSEQEWEQLWLQRRVNLHRFDITEPAARYTSSGSVPGELRNQFSLSEYKGDLRIVTTTGDGFGRSAESHVRVLREINGELVEVGSVGNIGNGEAVQAVRFIGEIGYVVTFRQIDPFYVIDLAIPEAPVVKGELKIPGFSSYLHPIGEGRILGVGSDADEEGRVTGAKVSLFDVSNLEDPREVAVWTAPDSWNNIGWEHRSFLWWAPEQLAVIPVQVWSDNWAGAVLLRIDDNSISEVTRLDHLDTDESEFGATDCRTVTAADLPGGGLDRDPDSELEYILSEEAEIALVLACGPGETTEAAGFECFDEEWLAEEATRVGLELGEDERLVMCWPGESLPTIVRSVVIGDDLWTVSFKWGDIGQTGRLQSNDLSSFVREAVLPI